ncbi:hypothetical protein VPH35_114830 [Triticum aestivum]
MTWLPRLRELKVMGYPKQLSVPPVPWTPAACSPDIKRAGYGLEELYSSKEFVIHNTRKFLASFEYPQTYKKEVASCKLHRLDTDDLTAFLAGLLYHHMILKSHFEKQYTPHATSAIQVNSQELKPIVLPHSSHVVALPQACPNNSSGGILMPLDLCDATNPSLEMQSHLVAETSLLSSSITSLCFSGVHEFECFSKELEDALQLLTSLQMFEFHDCDKLQCLPAGLQSLPSLMILRIELCHAFQSPRKDGVPTSLRHFNQRLWCLQIAAQ